MSQKIKRRVDLYLGMLILAAAVLAQGTLFSRLGSASARPDLLLVLVVCWSLLRSVSEGLVWAFLGGIGTDLIAGMPLGTSSLALMPICFLSGLGRNSALASSFLLPALLVALATPLHGWIILVIQQARGEAVEWIASSLRIIAPAMLLNALLAVVVHPLLRRVAQRMSAPAIGW